LEARLTAAGWKVSAAQKTVRGDRLAFDFSVVLTPVVLLDSVTNVAPVIITKAATQPGVGRRAGDAAAASLGDRAP